MTEYIEREAALNKLCRDNCGHDYNGKCYNCYTAAFIEQYPAADVAPVVHGSVEPLAQPQKMTLDSQCKSCKALMFSTDKFCPMCGTRMDGE